MRKIAVIGKLVIAASVILCLNACEEKSKKTFAVLADFEGTRIASLNGAIFPDFINPVIPNVEHKYFNTYPDIVMALSADKVDAAAFDMPIAKYLVAQNDNLMVFPNIIADDRYGFAVTKGSDFGVKGNEILQKLKENGTIAELDKIWFSSDESKKILPKLDYKPDFDGSAGSIKYATESTMVPMSYIDSNGKPTGFEIALVSIIAYELNMTVEFTSMAFDALLPALASGKANMVGGSMSMTEERLKSVDFIGPNYEGGIVLVIKKDRLAK